MINGADQERAIFRGTFKAILLGIVVIVMLMAACYGYFEVQSQGAKAKAAETERKAAAHREESMRRLRELD